MRTYSPFSLQRFEHNSQNLYFLPSDAFRELTDARCTFLIGSRGTGKTTLLNALNWKEQLHNASLKEHLLGTFADRRYIGVYVRVPAMHVPAFERWHITEVPDILGSVFSVYMDLTWLQDLAVGVSELIKHGVLKAKPRVEKNLVTEICVKHPELLHQIGSPPTTLTKLGSIFNHKRRELEKMAIAGASIAPSSLGERMPLSQIGKLGRSVGVLFAEFCGQSAGQDAKTPWMLKVCFDEAECLSESQQITINTMVRLCEAPLSYVVSYVRPMPRMSETYLPNMTLQSADRRILALDEISDDKFKILAEGVSSVRLSHAARSPAMFSLKDTLGVISINSLLQRILETSESHKAKTLLNRARQFKETAFGKKLGELAGTDEDDNGCLPIYQAYLVDRLRIDLPHPDSPRWERRSHDSATLRKRIVAAYLCLCQELNQQVRYAYAEMVLQMSDKCIRDYLAQMHEVFIERGQPVESFLKTRVPVAVQNAALRRASAQKREFISASGVSSPNETQWLVDALGQLTALIQNGPSLWALRSPERGVFSLRMSTSVPFDNVKRVIEEAAEAGFLKIEPPKTDELRFRVHCSLAAVFEFSYRGSQYEAPIKSTDLIAICHEADRDKRTKLVEALANALNREDSNLSLFEDFDD